MVGDSPRDFFLKWGVVLPVVLALIVGFGVGRLWGGAQAPIIPPAALVNTDSGQPVGVDFGLFWETWHLLDQKYVNGTTTASSTRADLEARVYGAISGLVNSLGDPYTVFLPPEENKVFADDIRGDFGGVGMELGLRDGALTVISALEGTPAKRAGIQPADRIIRINGEEASRLPIDQAIKKIRGEVGTEIKLTIFRPTDNKTYDLTLVRDRIQLPTLDTELLPSGIFVIKLHSFNAVAPNLFRQALRQFINAKTDKLILDLRGNPGGYLEAAVSMASWFLPEGKVVVREYHAGKEPDKIYRSYGYNIFTDRLKMVILIDKGSASASEILAGALAEHGRAVLIGEESFGKGSVQELLPLSGGSALKVTVAKWLTPNGHSISDNGLKPSITVARTEEDVAVERDPQLDRAVQYLLTGK